MSKIWHRACWLSRNKIRAARFVSFTHRDDAKGTRMEMISGIITLGTAALNLAAAVLGTGMARRALKRRRHHRSD